MTTDDRSLDSVGVYEEGQGDQKCSRHSGSQKRGVDGGTISFCRNGVM